MKSYLMLSHLDTGLIYTMGSNNDGRLGIGDRTVKQAASPTLVEDLSSLHCAMISCGWGHTIAIMGKEFSKKYLSSHL